MKLKLWIKILVSVGLLVGLFYFLPWEQVREAISRMSLLVWLGVLAGFLLGHRFGASKWRRLVNAGRANLQSRDAVRFYFVGVFANTCLPSIVGGDVIRAALAARATGRPEATILGSIADRLMDILTTAILLAVGAVLARGSLPAWGDMLLRVGLLLTAVAVGAMVLVLLRLPLRRWPRRFRRRVGRSLVALRYLSRDRSAALTASAISIGMQSGFVVLNYWIGRTLGIDVPLGVWFLVWPLAKLAALVPLSVGGLAVRDATLGGLLVPFGVPMALGVVASLIWQSIIIVGGLLGGLYWWVTGRGLGVRWADATRPVVLASGGRNHG